MPTPIRAGERAEATLAPRTRPKRRAARSTPERGRRYGSVIALPGAVLVAWRAAAATLRTVRLGSCFATSLKEACSRAEPAVAGDPHRVLDASSTVTPRSLAGDLFTSAEAEPAGLRAVAPAGLDLRRPRREAPATPRTGQFNRPTDSGSATGDRAEAATPFGDPARPCFERFPAPLAGAALAGPPGEARASAGTEALGARLPVDLPLSATCGAGQDARRLP